MALKLGLISKKQRERESSISFVIKFPLELIPWNLAENQPKLVFKREENIEEEIDFHHGDINHNGCCWNIHSHISMEKASTSDENLPLGQMTKPFPLSTVKSIFSPGFQFKAGDFSQTMLVLLFLTSFSFYNNLFFSHPFIQSSSIFTFTVCSKKTFSGSWKKDLQYSSCAWT